VEIETVDGICPAALSLPVGDGPWPAVIMFSDAGGMRETMRQMGQRLSNLGYVVLLPDFYYRNGPYDPVDMRTAFSTKETAEKIMGMMRGYTADLVARDAGAFVDYLDSLPETRPGGVGTTGYCMGGRLSLITAANLGERIAAAASFHGGTSPKSMTLTVHTTRRAPSPPPCTWRRRLRTSRSPTSRRSSWRSP
jgi:carboxymethylenebutenolidase